jgi:four helix bundle protein
MTRDLAYGSNYDALPSPLLRTLLRDTAVSTSANTRFTLIARGSLKEAETQIILAQRLGFLTAEVAERLLTVPNRINRMLTALKNSLRA